MVTVTVYTHLVVSGGATCVTAGRQPTITKLVQQLTSSSTSSSAAAAAAADGDDTDDCDDDGGDDDDEKRYRAGVCTARRWC